mmetsp:Transcript_1474/g.2239  ORF Transcript_1474/g.2239 Transcript_1474/m.2239 type:complete len:269 (-) Transcript_1474:129-935(-)
MPGPKMGPRPLDFDENIVRQSPTFVRWLQLKTGERLRYACRDFIRGNGDDEERLMRRIMIARRNNLRDHEALKRARVVSIEKQRAVDDPEEEIAAPAAGKKRKTPSTASDAQVVDEMDVAAVEATRSYRTWRALLDGEEFIYNQRYIKGKEKHDWLLRKNIWRRMRYRRENKKMVREMLSSNVDGENNAQDTVDTTDDANNVAAGIVDHALLASAAAAAGEGEHIHKSVVEKAVVDAAVAAAESYVKSEAMDVRVSVVDRGKIASMEV